MSAVNRKPGLDAIETLDKVKAAGGEAFDIEADMRDPAAVKAMVKEAAKRGGRLDYIVSNAAINPFMPWDADRHRGFQRTLRDQCARRLGGLHGRRQADDRRRAWRRHRHDFSSISAHVGSPTQVAYCGTKGAITMLGKALGSVLGNHGIRVNVVEPGAVRTNMSAPMFEMPDVMKYYEDRIALHRVAEPHELAATVAFLLSDDASYVTSASLLVDAGFIVNAEL